MKKGSLWFLAAALLACSGPENSAVRNGTDGTGGAGNDPDGGTLNGVTCDGVRCDPNATCSGEGDDAKCECVDGYEGDGRQCEDVDECADGELNDCDENADCINRPGTHACRCKAGFLGDGKSCDAIDACDGDRNVCDPNAVCVTEDSGFSCECKPGYTGEGLGCSDVDECEDDELYSCAANARCENTFGGYDCVCELGYSGEGDTACTSWCDAAKADTSVCHGEGICRLKGTEGVCEACAPGFTGNGKSCTEADDCPEACDGVGDDEEHTICVAGGDCACAPGYSGSPGSCRDTDECEDAEICGPNAKCTNAPGGYLCECEPGHARNGDGECADVNECAREPGPCHPEARCTNRTPEENPKGYECECPEGFTGDGTICTDIDECAEDDGGCEENAACVNERGSSRCECQAPLVGDPDNCHCDLTGLWAMRQDLDTCWPATEIVPGENLVSAGDVEATIWEIRELVYDGEEIRVRARGCGADNEPDLVSPIFRETYSSFIPYSVFDDQELQQSITFEQRGIVPGMSFKTPSEASGAGIDLGDDPLNARWPTREQMKPDQWVDLEGDGQPGATLWSQPPGADTNSGTGRYSYLPVRLGAAQDGSLIIAERAACVSVAIRVISHLNVEVESCTKLTGTVVNEKTEGRVHSCILAPKGECTETMSTLDCEGWDEKHECTKADWDAARRCPDVDPKDGVPDCMCSDNVNGADGGAAAQSDIERLDDEQNQLQDTRATFEMIKVGDVGDDVTCEWVREEYPAYMRRAPTITCTTPTATAD